MLIPSPTLAASSSAPVIDPSILPAPLKDAVDTFNKLELKPTSTLPKLDPQSQLGIWDSFRKTWSDIDNWVKGTIGVSLSEILLVLGNLFVWFLEITVRILKWLLGLLERV